MEDHGRPWYSMVIRPSFSPGQFNLSKYLSLFHILLFVIICKILQIDNLGWGRESLFFCYRLFAIMWFLLGGVSSSFLCLG